MQLHRVFGPLASVAAALGLWVLIVGPAVDPFGGNPRVLSRGTRRLQRLGLGAAHGT